MAHMMSSDEDDSRQMFGNYGSESKIKTSGGDEPYSPSAPTDPTDTWSPKGLAKHMSAYSDIFEDPEVDPTEGSSSGSGGAKPKNTLKPRSTSMSDNRSPPRGGGSSSGVKRKSDDLSDSDSDDDDGHLQEGGASYSRLVQNSDGDSDSSDSSPSAATCAICLGKMRGEVGSPNVCEHTFCFECILEWSNNNATCPQDRKKFNLILVRQHLGGPILSELPVSQPEAPAEVVEENPTYCEVCAQCDREESLLLCDGCDMGYHLECLSPPLSTVPIEEWFCPNCADQSQSGGSSSWEQRNVSQAGPSSSSSGSRGSRSSQSQSRSSRNRDNHSGSGGRRRLIARTQDVERIRLRVMKKKRDKRKEKKRIKREKMKKVKTHENDNKLHRWGKESEGADVDSMYNSDDEATKILDGVSRTKHYSSIHAKERQEEKRANAAKVIRDGFFIPRPSYAGAKTSVVTKVASAPQPSASVDLLGDIFESQAIAFGSSKHLTLTEDRKLQPKDPKKFEEGSHAIDIPLPSHNSSKSDKEGTYSPSRSSKYKSSPRSSKRSPSPRNSKRSPSPRSSKRNPSPKSSRRSPSPRSSKRSTSPKRSKRSPSPKSSKRSSSPRSSRRSPPRGHYKRTPSPRGYKKRSPSPKMRKSSQDYKHEYSSRTERSRDDKYYSPLEARKKSPPKMSYGRPASNIRRDRDRRRSYSPEEKGYKAEYKKSKHYSPKNRQSKSPETVVHDRPEREKSPYRKDKSRDGYKDFHKGDKGFDKKDRSPQRKERSPYREKSPHRRDYSPIRERSPQRRERSPLRDRSTKQRELTPRREPSPFRSQKITSHGSRSRERSLGRDKTKVRERSQWSHSYFSSNGNDVNKSNSNSYSVHSVHNVQSSSKSQKGEISKQESSQDSSDEKSKTSRSSSKESSSSDSTSESSSSESEKKDSEDEASEQLSLHSVGNLMMALKNKKTIIDKGANKKKDKKEKDSKEKIKKLSSQHRVPENVKRRSIKDTITVSDETEEDEQPIQTINKLKVEPRSSSKHKSSSKDKESKRKKNSKRRHKSSSSSSSSNNSDSDSSDTEETDKEKSKGKFKNIESQKVKGKNKGDSEGPSSIGDKKISISLKDNFSVKINKKNALGAEEEPKKKLSGLPLPAKEVEDKYVYFNPYEKKRVSHIAAPEEKPKILEVEKKPPKSSLFEKKSLVVTAANEVKVKEVPKKVSDKHKSVPSIPLPDEKLVREVAMKNNVIKDLIEEDDIIKDAVMQGSESQRDAAIKGVMGRKTDKSSIKVRSDVVKNSTVSGHDVKKSINTSIPSKSIPTIPLPLDAPKKKEESDDEIEEVWRKAIPGSSRRRSGDIKLNLLTEKARNNGKSKGQAEIKDDDDDDIIGIQVSKKKDDSHEVQNKMKKLFDEDKSKNKNEIKNVSEINQDKKTHKSENKEKDKYQSHRDSVNQVDGKQPKGTPKKDTSNLYTEKKSDIPGLDLISPKKRDSLDIELPTERKRTFSRSFGSDDFDFSSTSFDSSKNLDSDDKSDFKSTSFDIHKFIDGEMGKKSKEDRDLLKRQKREQEKERKVAECLKAFHRHKGVLDSEDEQEFKDSTEDLFLDIKTPKQSEKIEKRRSSTHGLVDKFVLQNNPDMKANSEDEDKPYSPTEDKPYSPTQSAHLESDPEIEDDVPYSPSQHVPDEEMPVPKASSPGPPNKRLQTPKVDDLSFKKKLTGDLQINKGLLESKVIEEVKKYLDPYYRDKTFNREQYKQIVSKCVDKVVNVECGYVIEPNKMHKLVDGYVKLFKHRIKKDRMLKL